MQTDQHKKIVSIVVPVFNEEENIESLYNRVIQTMAGLHKYNYEIIFTDNHSSDNSFERLKYLADKDRRVRVIRFSRNFGYQRSILTGYLNASGDAAIQLDCDMQDPPELIPEFIKLWEKGYHIVYGIRRTRKESWWITGLRKGFYRVADFLSEDHLPHDAGDFRLLDRKVLNELKMVDDAQPYLRGAIASIGFNQIGIPYDRDERIHGKSKFLWKDMFNLAIDGILNHSIVPLRIATYTGLVVSLLTFAGIFIYIIGRLFLGQNWPAGFATITVLILLSLSLNALFLGIIGEYLGRIYKQVKKRPLTIVEQEANNNKQVM